MCRRQQLPLHGEHPVPLQVTKGGVLAEDVETVRRAFEGATRAMPAVGSFADVGVKDGATLRCAHSASNL
jgi:hypothetical protein